MKTGKLRMRDHFSRLARCTGVLILLIIAVPSESSLAADSAASLCSIRLQQDGATEYFNQTTTPSQRRLYELVRKGNSAAVLDAIPAAQNLNFRVPGSIWLVSFAVQSLNVEIVAGLLDAGADSSRQDCQGWPPLVYLELPRDAEREKNRSSVEIADLLVLHGASIEGKSNDRVRRQLLARAAINGDIPLLEWLKRGKHWVLTANASRTSESHGRDEMASRQWSDTDRDQCHIEDPAHYGDRCRKHRYSEDVSGTGCRRE